ncbi:unnamed protein product [Rhizoctonia solani]|uniref:DUF7587 domain-containing protein n=1 Tax=Rhizoctonia solani TaxID=456999 RepID=A0A8H3CWA0_9AGAM|nr:unnamed protein product [Rhizoctonia solani]
MAIPDLKDARHLVERVESTRLVFRVFDNGSRQYYHPDSGFIAYVDYPFDPSDPASVERSVEKHLRYNNREATPWISTTRRWLWAIWEANRRANKSSIRRSNIRIAVIDLDACLAASPGIHALSALANAEVTSRCFADVSDEILIYRQIPASAVISIWSFDRCNMSALPSQFVHPLPSSENAPGWPQRFWSSYCAVASQFLKDQREGRWNAGEVGMACADVTLAMLKDAYTRLVNHVEEVVHWARATETEGTLTSKTPWLRIRRRRLTYPYPFSQADVISVVHRLMKELVQLPDPFCQEAVEAVVTKELRYSAYRNKRKKSSKRMYRGFLIHKNTFMNHVMSVINASALVIKARQARHKLDKFLTLALEMARTVPLGLMDELEITPSDWTTMKRYMLQKILTELAPLENKLIPLVNAPWIGSIFDPQGRVVPDVGEARKRKWMRKEMVYPKWWEECGTRESKIHHFPAARLY